MCYINSAKHLKQSSKHYLGVIKMVVSMTDEERQTLNVILTALETLPAERVAYAQGYLQAMADLTEEKEQRPA